MLWLPCVSLRWQAFLVDGSRQNSLLTANMAWPASYAGKDVFTFAGEPSCAGAEGGIVLLNGYRKASLPSPL